jgi:hypothetical protein
VVRTSYLAAGMNTIDVKGITYSHTNVLFHNATGHLVRGDHIPVRVQWPPFYWLHPAC